MARPVDCSIRHGLPRPLEVIQYKPSHASFGLTMSSLTSFGSKFRNCRTEIQFQENPSELILSHGTLRNGSVIGVSFSGKLIREYVDDGFSEDAIKVYVKMLECGIPIEEFWFFPCLIKAFGALCDRKKVRQIHGHLFKLGALDDIYVGNSLLDVYLKCGVAKDVFALFEKMCEKDLVSWNTMISGLCHSGDHLGSLRTFSQMILEHGLFPNRVACLSALSSCSSIESLLHGREIHAYVVKMGIGDEFLVSKLIDTYMRCGDVKNAEYVFRGIFYQDSIRGNTVIWNVMILGYVSNGYLSHAVELFQEMLVIQILPDFSTMVAVLELCSELLDLAVGKQIHGFAISLGLDNDLRVKTALIDMYFKCGDTKSGLEIFRMSQNRNTVMWGAVILNCLQSDCPNEALELFHDYLIEYGFVDSVIVLAVLRACSSLILKPKGLEVHGLVVKSRFDSDVFVGGALVDVYAKCGDMESAQKVFDRLPARDLITWNALILGYAQNEFANETLKACRDMQSEHIRPNAETGVRILSVCALLSAMILCKEVHGYLLRQGLDSNVPVNNSLIAAYAKCGDINSSWAIFEKMPVKNHVSWNSILWGLGMYGHADEIFVLFEKMKEGMKPDHATFTALLSACSHAGRIEEGWKYFRSMAEECKLEPQLEQYTCMVDLLGRAGHLKQAYDMILMMPCDCDDKIWGSLLASCKNYGDERLAEVVANHIFELDSISIGYRVLLANLYEEYGKWNEVTRVRTEIKGRGLRKSPGCSWIEIKNKIHTFTAGDHSHNLSEEIYLAIKSLSIEVEKTVYLTSHY